MEGCIVSIDAMGCRYEIADRIVNARDDYLFTLKAFMRTLTAPSTGQFLVQGIVFFIGQIGISHQYLKTTAE